MSLIGDQIKQLRKYSKELESSCYPNESYMVKQAADTIEELSTKLHASQMERSLQYYNDGWIPVSDRLPEEHANPEVIYSLGDADIIWHNASDLVLVTVYDRNIDKTYVSNDMMVDVEWANYKEDLGFKILAWQPMPTPYKGKERD